MALYLHPGARLLSGTPLAAGIKVRAGISISYIDLLGSLPRLAWYFYVPCQMAAKRFDRITPETALLLGNTLTGEIIDAEACGSVRQPYSPACFCTNTGRGWLSIAKCDELKFSASAGMFQYCARCASAYCPVGRAMRIGRCCCLDISSS